MGPDDVRDDGSLPDFLIIGAAKCGTTALHHYLDRHSSIRMCRPKEPHFFTLNWDRGVSWYRGLFSDANGVITGEASTSYTQAPYPYLVPARIHTLLPEVRMVYLVRDPVERIRSQYVHYVDRGKEDRSFDDAIRSDPRYVHASRYGYQLSLFLEHFDRDQLHVVFSTDLKRRREATLKRIFAFLGVDPGEAEGIETLIANASRDKRRTWGPLLGLRRAVRRHDLAAFLGPRARRTLHRVTSRRMERLVAARETERFIRESLADDHRLFVDLLRGPGPPWKAPTRLR